MKKLKLRGVHNVLEFKDQALNWPRDVVHYSLWSQEQGVALFSPSVWFILISWTQNPVTRLPSHIAARMLPGKCESATDSVRMVGHTYWVVASLDSI